MRIAFSMDGIKTFDLLYTYTLEEQPGFGVGRVEHYHGDIYCRKIIMDVWTSLASLDWKEHKYIGSCDRVAKESFKLISKSDSTYWVSFAINTYDGKAARMEVELSAPEGEGYDHRLEKLKIALKNRLLSDWERCTWLVDDQTVELCKDAYEKTFSIENNLRAFASKVLIHFLGVDWIKKAGLEKEAESVDALKDKFTKRVPEFDNINTDFLSMTLETLMKVMFDGIIYKDEVVLSRLEYQKVQEMQDKGKSPGICIAEYIKKRRTTEKHIWNDLFAPYIAKQDEFKGAIHNFIEDRNHVAHSKVLSWNAYQAILQDFSEIRTLILAADTRFEQEETSDEVVQTWEAEQETAEAEEEYHRYRLASETGMDILDESGIRDWFEEVLHDLFNSVYQRYHFDVCYEISDLFLGDEDEMVFTVSSPAVEDGSAIVKVGAKYSIDDELGADSCCYIVAKNNVDHEVCKAVIRFHNGDGCENDEGIMEPIEDSMYDDTELEEFQNELFTAIESLNPYPDELRSRAYQSGDAVQYVADFTCEQCGKLGISIDETFLTIGRCCYCGYENELVKCERCGVLVGIDDAEHGLCPSCVAYIDGQ